MGVTLDGLEKRVGWATTLSIGDVCFPADYVVWISFARAVFDSEARKAARSGCP